MYSIFSFDPGKVTGVAYGTFSDTEPLTVGDADAWPYELLATSGVRLMADMQMPDHVVSELFTLRSGNEFTADLTAKKVEALLEVAFGLDKIHWRDPSTKSQVPDEILKQHDLWRTGEDVDWEDGRDANDAIIHMLGYVAFELKHKPTLEVYFR